MLSAFVPHHHGCTAGGVAEYYAIRARGTVLDEKPAEAAG
jgi:hypothetical protein